ncbi:MAG: UDP-N-acetylglucosamine 2-epimerase (hydrolyzing) [Candidatus Omnitrophica bacterium]|nr:UDP-N-acetylglucosamine 2-epimerase (hydrolyzing) [Candidatus Omnitrophota bacterium]
MQEKRKIALVTGSRGEYGYIRPIIREIEKHSKELQYETIVTNLHLLPDFGSSIEELERDKVKISDKIYMAVDGYTPASMSKSLGLFLLSVTDSLVRLRPDILLLAGDRGEQLMAAIAACHMNIPVAHIQAGERSGNIDGMTRHAITRYAHLHFASSEDAAQRLRQMGEQEFRIHLTGAPQLDELMQGYYAKPEELKGFFRIDFKRPLALFVQHPVTEEYENVADQTKETLEALCALEMQTLAIFPNNDAGNKDVRKLLEEYRRPYIHIERNVSRYVYLGLMKAANVMVGNSSSGLIEAPYFKLPVVNVGTRQRDRDRAANVIDVTNERRHIGAAIKRALSSKFRQHIQEHCKNPYWSDGKSSAKIVDILRKIPLTEDLIKKQITY